MYRDLGLTFDDQPPVLQLPSKGLLIHGFGESTAHSRVHLVEGSDDPSSQIFLK